MHVSWARCWLVAIMIAARGPIVGSVLFNNLFPNVGRNDYLRRVVNITDGSQMFSSMQSLLDGAQWAHHGTYSVL